MWQCNQDGDGGTAWLGLGLDCDVRLWCGSDSATKTMVELLGSYTDENASQAREDAHK